MNRFFLHAATGFVVALAQAAAGQSSIRDSAGREIRPAKVERVYAAGPPASVLVFAIAPHKLTGWMRALRPDEAKFFPERYARLPELGRLTGRGNTANIEVVLNANTDLIVDVGATDPTLPSLASQVEEQTGIPYLSRHLPFGWFDFPPGANREPSAAQLDALLAEPGVLPQ